MCLHNHVSPPALVEQERKCCHEVAQPPQVLAPPPLHQDPHLYCLHPFDPGLAAFLLALSIAVLFVIGLGGDLFVL